jgi:hypothetical protein
MTDDGLQWITTAHLAAQGYRSGGPELDFGANWGEHHTVRVSFAPHAERPDGYLYAHDRSTDRVAVLCPATTAGAVDQAWNMVLGDPPMSDGHLLLADILNERSLRPASAEALWRHCLVRELDARSAFDAVAAEPNARLGTAAAVVLAMAARASAEQLHIDAIGSACEQLPVVVRYQVQDRSPWSGRVAASDVAAAADVVSDLRDQFARRGRVLHATSVSAGHVVVDAERVPALAELGLRRAHGAGLAPSL